MSVIINKKLLPTIVLPLDEACQEGRLDRVKFLLQSQNYSIESLTNPFLVACANSRVSLARLLLDNGASPENGVQNYMVQGRIAKCSPLGMACIEGSLAIVQLLVRQNVFDVDRVLDDNSSALMVAIEANQSTVTRFLLSFGVSLSTQNKAGDTAIHIAARKKDISQEILQLLIEKGNIDLKTFSTPSGFTPLHAACMQGLLENTQCLTRLGASIHTKDNDGTTPLHWACTKSLSCPGSANHDLVVHLLEAGADANARSTEKGTPLHCACEDSSNLDIVNTLLNYGADIDAVDEEGFTALYLAYRLEHMELVDVLLKRGANINAKNGYERTTILHKACYDCDAVRIESFLEAGANMMIRNRFGWNLLHFCIKNDAERLRLASAIQVILVHIFARLGNEGAKEFFNSQDMHLCTPLFLACRAGKFQKAEILLSFGAADPNIQGLDGNELLSPAYVALSYGYESLCMLVLQRNGAKINASNGKEEMTLLHRACRDGKMIMISYLLENGASMHQLSANGCNALHYAAGGGHCDALRILLDLCVSPDIDPLKLRLFEKRDYKGRTPIHHACSDGYFGTAQLLVERGACVTDRDLCGALPVECAALNNSCSSVFLMLNTMAGSDWFGRGRLENRSHAKVKTTCDPLVPRKKMRTVSLAHQPECSLKSKTDPRAVSPGFINS